MPPITSKPKVTPAAAKPTAIVKAKAGLIQLPTEKSMPSVELKDYISLWYGPPGVGKTTVVDSLAPRVLFCSTDRGTRFMPALRTECLSWEQFDKVLAALESGQDANYDFVAIDHVQDWADMAEQYILNKYKIESLADAGYGKGWSTYKKELRNFISRFKRLKCGLIFISHESVIKVKVKGVEIDRSIPNISKQAWDVIVPLADLVCWCGTTSQKTPQGGRKEVRIIRTDPTQEMYAKDRTRRKRPPAGELELLDGRKFVETFRSI